MTQSDDHPVARKVGNPTEARRGQFPSSMSVHSTGNGKHRATPAQGESGKGNQSHVPSQGHGAADDQIGRYRNGYEGANHDPTSTQGWGSQDPGSMSVHRAGYEHQGGYKDAGHGPPSTRAQGKSGNGSGYDYGATIHKPSPTEVKEHQSHVFSTGYGTGYDRVNDDKDPVQKPPPTEVAGNHTRDSSPGYDTGYDRANDYKDAVQHRGGQDPSSMLLNSTAHGKQPSTPAQGRSGKGDQTGRFENGYKGAVHKPPSNLAWGSQDPSSFPSHGKEHGPNYPHPTVVAYQPTSAALPPGPGNGHDKVSGREDPINFHKTKDNSSTPPAVPINVNVNLHFGQDGTYRVNPASAQAPVTSPAPVPINLPPPKRKSCGCCPIL